MPKTSASKENIYVSEVVVSRFALLLSHLRVIDAGSGMVQERNLARLLVGDGKGILQVAVAIPKRIARYDQA
jgi:hypothetical protein